MPRVGHPHPEPEPRRSVRRSDRRARPRPIPRPARRRPSLALGLRRLRRRFRLGTDSATLLQSLGALGVASVGGLVAGVTLGSITGTLEELPGLLVLVPAAIGMRGNIFGAMSSRLGTAIHAGTFSLSLRRGSVVGDNIGAAMALSLSTSALLAVLAKAVAVAFGVADTISVAGFVVVSVVGGMMSSFVVLAVTLGVARASVRYRWDLDNVAAPIITAAGDMVTLPSLFLATYLVGRGGVSTGLAWLSGLAALVAVVAALRSTSTLARRVVRESVIVLFLAGLVDVLAGVTIEKRLDSYLLLPGLLVMVPPFLEEAGAIGAILSSRLSSKLHLGLIEPTNLPQPLARADLVLTVVVALPVFAGVGVLAELAGRLTGLATPGLGSMVGVALVGGAMATAVALVVAYYGAIAAVRVGLDPDNHGIPLMTSSMDFVGILSLILATVLVVG